MKDSIFEEIPEEQQSGEENLNNSLFRYISSGGEKAHQNFEAGSTFNPIRPKNQEENSQLRSNSNSFCTSQQINKSIELQKELLNSRLKKLSSSLSRCESKIQEAFNSTQQLYHTLNQVDSEQKTFDQIQKSPLSLSQINYPLPAIPEVSTETKMDGTFQVLEQEVQDLQRHCAQFFLSQSQKIEAFETLIQSHLEEQNQAVKDSQQKADSYCDRISSLTKEAEQVCDLKVKKLLQDLNRFEKRLIKAIQKVE